MHSARIVICCGCAAKVRIKKDIGLYSCPSCKKKLVSISDSVSAQYLGATDSPNPKVEATHQRSAHKSLNQKKKRGSSSPSQPGRPMRASFQNAGSPDSRDPDFSNIKSSIFNIVGFKHRGVDLTFLQNLDGNSIKFLPEPNNSHDPNAVKCLTSGHHFGYIERSRAAEIQTLIKSSRSFTIEVLDFNQYKMSVHVGFQIVQEKKDLARTHRQPDKQIDIVAPSRVGASVSTPIRITENWVEIQIISEASIHITQRGYVPVLRVITDKHKSSRLLIISARSISFPLEEMRQDHGGKFSGLRFSLRKSGPNPKDLYEFQ